MLWTTKEYENNIKEYQILILIPGVTRAATDLDSVGLQLH